MSRLLKHLIVLPLFFLVACSSEKGTEMSAPKTPADAPGGGQQRPDIPGFSAGYQLQIGPASPTRSSTIKISMTDNFNPAEAGITWRVNGLPVVSDQQKFSAAGTKRGDTVQAIAQVQGREISSNTLTIKNAPPEISRIKLLPEVFTPGDTLSVDAAASDADGDEVAIAFAWTKNGEPAGDRERIEAPLKRGDKVSVKVTPFDGMETGRSVILTRDIRNLPPVIAGTTDYYFDGKVYTYQVKAADLDGDTLTYSLKTAPPGMIIDKTTGLITWSVPEEIKGKIPVAVAVTDGKGGEAAYSFTVTLTAAK